MRRRERDEILIWQEERWNLYEKKMRWNLIDIFNYFDRGVADENIIINSSSNYGNMTDFRRMSSPDGYWLIERWIELRYIKLRYL